MKCFAALTDWARWAPPVVTISGGEPLLHPELDAIIARIRRNGIMAGPSITNGYLLTADRIEKLNLALASNICRDQH